jgi:hypothetical protein
MADPIPMEVPSRKPRYLKGKKLVFSSSIVAEKVKLRRPFTRAASKQHILVKDDTEEAASQQKGKYQYSKHPIEVVDVTTPQHESNPTFKRLKRKLKEARVEADKLKNEDLGSKNKLSKIMGMYHDTIDKEMFLAKIRFPLHKNLKNIYRKNRSHQAQIKKLKVELQPFKEELAKRNLDMLAKVSTKRSSRNK